MDDLEFAPSGGACVGHPTEWWFPDKPSRPPRVSYEEAKKNRQMAIEICDGCKVKTECLDYSLRNEPFGIWGGMSEVDRAWLRVERGVTASRPGRINLPGHGQISIHNLAVG